MRFRPRFSLRTLAIVMTLVCAYFGTWEATDRYWVRLNNQYRVLSSDGRVLFLCNDLNLLDLELTEISLHHPSFVAFGTVSSPGPLIVSRYECGIDAKRIGFIRRRYYLWLFGPTVKLFDTTPDTYVF